MCYIAYEEENYELWDYMTGNIYVQQKKFEGIYKNGKYGKSINVNRYEYLKELSEKQEVKVSLRNVETNKWTQWRPFPEYMIETQMTDWGLSGSYRLSSPIDLHRSMLSNEIIIESDYPTYEENWDATRVIGKILEEKGFEPMYYFSGGKSIHIHIFLDWRFGCVLDDIVRDQLKLLFSERFSMFQKKFIEWLRTKMINCWDTDIKKFDTDLIRGTHLIRAELSKNEFGFKTFLGYTYKNISFVPDICNEENNRYPKLGEIKLSIPNDPYTLIDEFIQSLKIENKREKLTRKNYSLSNWMKFDGKQELRSCVKMIYNDDFKKYNDGKKRGMFILINELRKVFGDDKAKQMIINWNERMGSPLLDSEIDYRLQGKIYTLSCKYIHNFLKEFGIKLDKNCRFK